ncbi:hypothetical protein GCM10017771_70920 [Streptomyces capitiformicae]|uniref:UspA domain-containing protein n=1 Tax=Streptomyces capitiformicae TaxID=2014920 RepID=A0A919DJN5_9ACTN|nr:hypothetical protein GCM10017771_70920 [Streptomyces capitiformicae]
MAVGIDGSEASLEAVDWAADEAVRHDVPLHHLHAAARDDERADVISGASKRAGAGDPSVRLSSEVLYEDAAAALVDKGRNAFTLVLGSRGLGALAGMLLGSVSLAVAARADCPVVVSAWWDGAPRQSVRGHRRRRRGRGGQRYGRAVRVPRGPCAALPAGGGACLERPGRDPTPPGVSGYALQALQRPPAQVLAEALHDAAERYQEVPVSSEVVEGRRGGHFWPVLICSLSAPAGGMGTSVCRIRCKTPAVA